MAAEIGLPEWLPAALADSPASLLASDVCAHYGWDDMREFVLDTGVPEPLAGTLGIPKAGPFPEALLPALEREFGAEATAGTSEFREALALVVLLATDEHERPEFLRWVIESRGSVVASQNWDGGGPGLSGIVSVARVGNAYFSMRDGEVPDYCGTLESALADSGVLYLGTACDSIWVDDWSEQEVVDHLDVADSVEPGQAFSINGSPWHITDEGRLRRRE